jgi:hypothetical protein
MRFAAGRLKAPREALIGLLSREAAETKNAHFERWRILEAL